MHSPHLILARDKFLFFCVITAGYNMQWSLSFTGAEVCTNLSFGPIDYNNNQLQPHDPAYGRLHFHSVRFSAGHPQSPEYFAGGRFLETELPKPSI